MKFRDFSALTAGLGLADKNAVLGMSKINPFPAAKGTAESIGPKGCEAVETTKTNFAVPVAVGSC